MQALVCMLAHYVEWRMQVKLVPLLSADQDPSISEAQRSSLASQGKAMGRPAHNFRALLEYLSTITCNRIEPPLGGVPPCGMLTRPTEVQRKALDLVRVELESVQ